MAGEPGFLYPAAQYPSAIPSEADFSFQTNNTTFTLATAVTSTGLAFTFIEPVGPLPASGAFTIDGERVHYNGKSGSFTLTLSSLALRGFDNSTPVIHNAGVPVTFDNMAFQHNKVVTELRAVMIKVDTLTLAGSVVTANGSGLQGGAQVSTNPAISLIDQSVASGTYQNATLSVNGKGIITGISSGSPTVTAARAIATTSGHLTGGGDLSQDRTIGLAIIPGLIGTTYATPTSVTCDQYGRITAIVAGATPPVLKTAQYVSSTSLAPGTITTLGAAWSQAWGVSDVYSVMATITANANAAGGALFHINVTATSAASITFIVKNIGVASGTFTASFLGVKL